MRSQRLRYAAISATVWAAAVGALAWHLPRWAAEEVRAGRLAPDADSTGLPLLGIAVVLAGALVVINVAAALLGAWRRRRERSATVSRAAG